MRLVVEVDIVVENSGVVGIPVVLLALEDWNFDPSMRNSGGCVIPDCKCWSRDDFFVEA